MAGSLPTPSASPCTIAGATTPTSAYTASICGPGSTGPSSSIPRDTTPHVPSPFQVGSTIWSTTSSSAALLPLLPLLFKIIIFRVEIFRREIFRVFGVHVVIQYVGVGSKEILLILPLLHDIDEGVKLLLDILCNATKRRGLG